MFHCAAGPPEWLRLLAQRMLFDDVYGIERFDTEREKYRDWWRVFDDCAAGEPDRDRLPAALHPVSTDPSGEAIIRRSLHRREARMWL